ncbi:MAG: YegS/Rv2252/BmrU family lipid kinase [Ruminococcaceae bacterium]|nr:YegS/Rv2252/BmrU family lipid kinase [Oscillospiraceae bacterium]
MNKRVLLILNPCSGQKAGKRYLADVVEIFCRAGFTTTVFTTLAAGDGCQITARHAADHDLVVCMGGDGTFNEVVSGMIASGANVPIGYIPCGSTNDFASSVGLSKKLLKAAQDIVDGVPQTFDVGLFGDRHFTYIASFGAFTRASYDTPQSLKNMLGHLAYVLSGIQDLFAIKSKHLRVETEDATFEGDYLFGAISNSTSVAGILTLNPEYVDMNDGLLELLLIRKPRNPLELEECIRCLQKQRYNSPMLTFHSASRLKIIAPADMPWTLDGERQEGREEIEISNLHSAIQLILPAKASNNALPSEKR